MPGGHVPIQWAETQPDGQIVGRFLYRLGRFLQTVGLIVPLVGVSGNVARPEQITLKVSLSMAIAGVAIFYLGRFVQERGKA